MKCEAHFPVAYIGGPFPECICKKETENEDKKENKELLTTENISITNWEATNEELIIAVSYGLLGMSKKFVWKYHTTNHYGQGAKRCWWHWDKYADPTVEVYSGEGQDTLTILVRNHDPLKNLADHYRLPIVNNIGEEK